jgi:hypothetical protein
MGFNLAFKGLTNPTVAALQLGSQIFLFLYEITLTSYLIFVVAQLVEALRYKPEGRGFDSRWCCWIFSLTKSFRPHYGPGVD